MRLWLKYENKAISREALSNGTSYSIRKALPILSNLKFFDYPPVGEKRLVYSPHYFFEYIFRGSVRSPPLLFEDKGILFVSGKTREIFSDNSLEAEINNKAPMDYVVNTEGKYVVETIPSRIADFREARELVLDFIIKRNTRNYRQYYGNRSYDRIYVPRRYEISFIRSDFVQIPLFYFETCESDQLKHVKIVFASSGNFWNEMIYCPIFQQKVWIVNTVDCMYCGKKLCHNCIREKGILFKKRLCPSCLSKA